MTPHPLSGARWTRPGEQLVKLAGQAAYLSRCSFTVPAKVKRAIGRATALGVYELYVNGSPVGDALLRPGWTDYSCRVQYQEYDLTAVLAPGENVIGAIVGPGWYAGRIGTDWGARFTPLTPEFLLALDIEADDGSSLRVETGDDWEWRESEIISSDLYDGERVDLRTAIPGWSSASAPDLGSWETMELSTGTAAALVPECGPPIRETAVSAPGSITWLEDGSAVVDLGRNEAGYLRLGVRAESGARVQVSYGELLDVDGHVYRDNLRTAGCQDTFITAGRLHEQEGTEVLAPRFTFRGARYAEVRGLPGPDALVSAERVVIGTDVRRVGWFESSDSLLNEIYACVLTSQRANFLEVPTDCPQRDERLGWMADALLFAPLAAYSYDIADFLAKWCDDILDARSSAGAFCDVAPRPPGRAMFRNREGAPAWADAGVLLPWLVYRRYGRRDVLERMFPAMMQWLRLIHEANPDGIWRHLRGRDYGDWVPAGPDTSHDLFATAWLCHSTQVAAAIAEILGSGEDEQWLTARAAAARSAFNEAFVDAEAARVRAPEPVASSVAKRFAATVAEETQTGYVLAIVFELVDDKLAERLGDRLAEMVSEAGNRLQTGFTGSAYLLDALAKGGRAAQAVELLLRREYPSLGYMVDHGATSIWERWNGIEPAGGPASATMNSFNHYCLGSMFNWAIESLSGLRPGPGIAFESFAFSPCATPRIDWVSFRFAAPSGEIAVRWEQDGATVTGEVTVPVGVTCRVASEISFGENTAQLDSASLPDGQLELGAGTHRVLWRSRG